MSEKVGSHEGDVEKKERLADIEVRPYSDEDYDQVSKNLQETDMYDETWDSKENLASMIEKNPESVLVAQKGNEVIGSVVTTPFGDRVGFVYRLVVNNQHRQSGVGSQLLEGAEARLRKRGAKEVALFVNTDETELADFYTKRGYGGSRKKYLALWKRL